MAPNTVSKRAGKGTAMKSKTRKGQASRAHSLQKIVGRGLGAAVKAYAIAKKGIKTGNLKNMVSDALVSTTRTLLGATCAAVTGRGYQAGMSVEYKKGKDGVNCNVAIDFSKTPKGGDGQPINAKLRFKSPVEACIGTLTPERQHQQESTITHPTLVPWFSRSRIDGDGRLVLSPQGVHFLEMGRATALPPNTSLPRRIDFDSVCKVKSEPVTSPFETVPLGNFGTPLQPYARIKEEDIKREFPR